MKLFGKLVFGLLFASVSLGACTLDDRIDPVDLVDEAESATALQVGEVAPIKTVAALHRYLENTASSPLDRLAPDARQRFLRSLSFSKDGVSGFQYSELSSLSASEVYQVLSLFGLERTAARIKPAPGVTPSPSRPTACPETASATDARDTGRAPRRRSRSARRRAGTAAIPHSRSDNLGAAAARLS